jgi:hypothetical protein
MPTKAKHPVGDLRKLPPELHSDNIEGECLRNEHPAAEVSEHAYRRGFQQGVVAASRLLKLGATAAELDEAAESVACDMRYDKKPHRWYMHEFMESSRLLFRRFDLAQEKRR